MTDSMEGQKLALELQHVRKSFGKGSAAKEIIGDVSFKVAEGEFVSLVGPSGSGKSTLFQIIGGLEAPTEGTVSINGNVTTGERGHISYMPQQASLMPWRTVAANIELALEVAGVERTEARSRAKEWLARVGLETYTNAYPHVLSGGMQQRVSFLRALLAPQSLMLLDEPFGALDALTRLNMQKWLLKLWENNRRSVLLITHSIEEALLLSDRIIVFSASPAIVLKEIKVPFVRPRGETLWTDETFNRMKQEIYELLRNSDEGAIARG